MKLTVAFLLGLTTAETQTNFREHWNTAEAMKARNGHRFFEHTMGDQTENYHVHATGHGGGLGGDENSQIANQQTYGTINHDGDGHHAISARAQFDDSHFDTTQYDADGNLIQSVASEFGRATNSDKHYVENTMPGQINAESTHTYTANEYTGATKSYNLKKTGGFLHGDEVASGHNGANEHKKISYNVYGEHTFNDLENTPDQHCPATCEYNVDEGNEKSRIMMLHKLHHPGQTEQR